MRHRSLALLVLSGWLLAWPAPPGRSQEEGETLFPGQPRERAMTAWERHTYRVDVGEEPVLIRVEQQGIDLVIEARGPGAAELRTGLGGSRWGLEAVLIESAGERRIEVRPKEKSIWPGRYSIAVETLTEPEGSARRQALALMSRAGREGFEETPEARRQAAASCREALAAWRSLGDRRWEAEALSCLALLEYASRELRPAIEDNERALAIWRELGDQWREAAALNELGLNRIYAGDAAGAREALAGSLSLWKSLGQRFDQAETRSNLCFVEQRAGDLPAALACYEEPRAVFQEAGIQSEEQRILNNLGGIFDLLGEPDAALDHYRRSLELRRALGDELGEAQTLNNIAVIHRTLGEWQEALRLYGQAREILDRLGDRALKASVLANVGFTYNNLGEPQRALAFVEESLQLRREIGDRRGEAVTLSHLGNIWRRPDDYRQALELAAAMKDARLEAFARVGLADVLIEKGDPVAALSELEPALSYLKQASLRSTETQALQHKGRALILAGRSREALPILQDAVERQRALRNRAGEAGALHALAAAERSLGLHQEARAHAEAAVARAEELRSGFVSPDLRAAFQATQRRAYSLLIDLLMDRHAADSRGGHDRTAFEVSERARARSLLDVLFAGSTAQAGSAVPASLHERRQSLRRRLSAKADQQLRQGGDKAEALGREIEALLAELDSVEAEIRRLDPRYAAVSAPPDLGVEDVAGLLDPGSLLLEYSLGEERSFLWAVGTGGLRSFVLPSRKEIEGLVRQAYDDLSTVGSGAERQREAMEALGRILLGPVWGEAAQIQRLIVVPDGALYVLPFTALRMPGPGGGPVLELLERQEVVYVPSATTLALQRRRLERRPPASKRVAILADPVFSPHDSRIPRAPSNRGPLRSGPADGPLPGFERLQSSRIEAEEIAALAPADQVWKGLDFKAGREAVLSGELRSYQVLHFATHGVADTLNPELSGLMLSLVDAAGKPREGFLGLSDVYELDLGADLVVLSGCRTALGKEVHGEGLMGLTRAFLYAGVPRVVGTLWPVQDRNSAELMSRFYKAMWQDGLTAAAALRKAQLSLRSQSRYRDPYSWAGFVLQGDWR